MDYLPIIIGFMVLLLGSWLILFAPFPSQLAIRSPGILEGMSLLLMSGGAVAVVLLDKWSTRLIALATAGFLVCFYFMLKRAPDLALTQMLIESATLILMLILLGRFPESAESDEIKDRRFTLRKGIALLLSAGVGLCAFFMILQVSSSPHPRPMGMEILEKTLPLALGNNAVNTILVDFRGFDTLFEITVLCIAALGCLGLLMRWKEPPR
jgi:multisubunit Na+/H+ antiporter MnhB subunit